jgi:hypothetical protein
MQNAKRHRAECRNLSRTADRSVAQEPLPLAVEVSVVRWCKDGHVGVEFLRYSQGARERVTDLVEALPPMEILARPDYATSTLSAVS